jgi:hypothetical protein
MPIGAGETPKDRAKAERVKAATSALTEGSKAKPLVGDFPPHYGKSVEEWRADRKRRLDREYERLEKLTPNEQDEEHAERKRRQEEWQKMKHQ